MRYVLHKINFVIFLLGFKFTGKSYNKRLYNFILEICIDEYHSYENHKAEVRQITFL